MDKFALIFKALSDKTRLRIINLLVQFGKELCVCEIVDSLDEPQYKISKHLKELKFAGLVEEKKEGKWVNYSLIASEGQFKKFLFKAIASIPKDITGGDENRLKARLFLRKNGECVVGLESKQWKMMLKELKKERMI
ncbi:MAG: ArsR/SmtB family transcription factor [Candidatus Aminicenantaceae bacterium]